MRALFILSILFFVIGFSASAKWVCQPGGWESNTHAQCASNCPGGSCSEVTGNGGNTGGTSGQFQNPLTSQSFEALVQSLARWVAAIALPIAAIFIIYSGFLFVTAGGNQSKIDAAKTTFYWTMIGAAIVVGAWALATAIVNFAKGL